MMVWISKASRVICRRRRCSSYRAAAESLAQSHLIDGLLKLSRISTIARFSNHVAIRQGKSLIIFPTEAASITSARATLLLHDNAW